MGWRLNCTERCCAWNHELCWNLERALAIRYRLHVRHKKLEGNAQQWVYLGGLKKISGTTALSSQAAWSIQVTRQDADHFPWASAWAFLAQRNDLSKTVSGSCNVHEWWLGTLFLQECTAGSNIHRKGENIRTGFLSIQLSFRWRMNGSLIYQDWLPTSMYCSTLSPRIPIGEKGTRRLWEECCNASADGAFLFVTSIFNRCGSLSQT